MSNDPFSLGGRISTGGVNIGGSKSSKSSKSSKGSSKGSSSKSSAYKGNGDPFTLGGILGNDVTKVPGMAGPSIGQRAVGRGNGGNNGFIQGAKVTSNPDMISTVPDYLKQTPAAAASQNAQSQQDNVQQDPLYLALMQAAANAGNIPSSSFKGNLGDYIHKAEGLVPGVSYAPAEAAIKQNAAVGGKNIGDMYSALAAYTAGQKAPTQQQFANSSHDLLSTGQDAANLGNSLYASLQGNMAQGAGSVAAGAQGTAAVGQNAALAQNDAHRSALADSLALGQQSAQVNNQSQENAALGWLQNSGNAAQLGGAQAKVDLQKQLMSQLAQYATLQSQADQSKAVQALQLGESQFNNDRTYAANSVQMQMQNEQNIFNRLNSLYNTQQSNGLKQQTIDNQGGYYAGKVQASMTAADDSLYKGIYNANLTSGMDAVTADKNARAAVAASHK